MGYEASPLQASDLPEIPKSSELFKASEAAAENEEWKRSSREVGGDVHDLNNLLTVMDGYIPMLRKQIMRVPEKNQEWWAQFEWLDQVTRVTEDMTRFGEACHSLVIPPKQNQKDSSVPAETSQKEKLSSLRELLKELPDLIEDGSAALFAIRMLENSLEKGSEEQKGAREVVHAVEVAVEMLRQMDRSTHHEPSEVDVNEFLMSEKELLARYALKGRSPDTTRLTIVPASEKLSITMIPTNLHRILESLITNARQALNQKGGAITIKTDKLDGHVVISVTDDGKGMSEEVQKNIFNPFFTTKGETGGTGLGLANVEEFVHEAHGTISVNSAPNAGTTFTITLPQSEIAQ